MNRLLVVSIVITLFATIATAQNPCGNIDQIYARRLINSAYTWGFDNNTHGAHYADNDPITATVARNAIRSAIGQWVNAVNAAGTVLTITETEDYQNASIKVIFKPLESGICGDSDWLIREAYVGSNFPFPQYNYLYTTILHEVGHVFLGSGHHSGYGVMSQSVGNNCNTYYMTLSSCETDRILDIYNPAYVVKVKNDFGNGVGGGSVNIDGILYQNIPDTGRNFTWRVSNPTHTITAVDHQEVSENNVVYVREYQQWRDDQNIVRATRPQLSFEPDVATQTYTPASSSFSTSRLLIQFTLSQAAVVGITQWKVSLQQGQ